MQRVVIFAFVAVLMFSCNPSTQKKGADTQITEKEKIVSVTIEEMLAQPAEYADKVVAISGMVTHVCTHGGQKCFVVGEDGETQIRIITGGDIDEFNIDLEGSTVAFKGTFKVLNAVQTQEHLEEHDSKEHHDTEMAHTEAEKADYFIEATDFQEITQ